MRIRTLTAGVAGLAISCLGAGTGFAQGPAKHDFKAVGSWNFTSLYKEVERPFFSKTITEASGGKIKIDHKSITGFGLSGFEVVDLTRKGVYDIVVGSVGYVASKSPALEGMDLAGAMPEYDDMRKSVNAYRPIVAREFETKYGVHLLAIIAYPSQQFWCNKPINKLEDLKGLRVRVYSASLADFVRGVGGVPVTIPFGEVVPALQKGVADCGITGTLPAYDAKWGEVVTHIYRTGLGWGLAFAAINKRKWDGLDKPTKDFLAKQFADYEEKALTSVKEHDEQGIICNTGKGGKCRFGAPGKMTLVTPDAADRAKIKEATAKSVLSAWAKRCGEKCAAEWNATIGKVNAITAKAN